MLWRHSPQAPARLQKAVMSVAVLSKTQEEVKETELNTTFIHPGKLILVVPYLDRGIMDAADVSNVSKS